MLFGMLGLAATAQAQTCNGSLVVPVAGSSTGLPLNVTEVHVNSACNTGSTPQVSGTITLTVTGGSPSGGTVAPANYTYSWTKNGSAFTAYTSGAALSNLGAGSYQVTVTDNASANTATTTPSSTNTNCSFVLGPILITEPTAIVPVATLTSNFNGFGISCALASTGNSMNGAVSVSATGGTGVYSYSWSSTPVQTSQAATGLAFGTYTATVTDANGCTQTASVDVTKPTNFVQTNSFKEPLCAASNGILTGIQGGTATITPTGGVTAYSYAWSTSPAQTTSTATGLAGGSYTVTATDANSCTLVQSYTLTEPAVLTNAFTVVLHNGAQISCATVAQGVINDGSVTSAAGGGAATVNNGATPNSYSYAWSNSVTTAANSSLTAGTYTVTITDGNGCTMSTLQTLVAPTAITAPGAITNLTCNQTAGNGGATGAVDLSPAGGTGTLTYLWAAGGQTSQDISGLVAATYTVTVTDVNSCTVSNTFIVAQPVPITFTTATQDYNGFGVSCNTAIIQNAQHPTNISNNGRITVGSAAGGNGTFTYSNGGTFQPSAIFSTLTPNTYTVTVKDGNGCTASSTSVITQPTLLTAGTCTAANDLCQLNTGQIKVQAQGGVAPYGVTWTAVGTSCGGSPAGTASQSISTSGGNVTYSSVTGNCTYSFIVTDTNGCTLP